MTSDTGKLYVAYQSTDKDNYQNIYMRPLGKDLGSMGTLEQLTFYNSAKFTAGQPSILSANGKFYLAYQLDTKLDKTKETYWDVTDPETNEAMRYIVISNMTDNTIYINEYTPPKFGVNDLKGTYTVRKTITSEGLTYSVVKNPFLFYLDDKLYVGYNYDAGLGQEVYVRKYYNSFEDTLITPGGANDELYNLYLEQPSVLDEMIKTSTLSFGETINWTLRNDVLLVNDTYYLAYVSQNGNLDISLESIKNITGNITVSYAPLITGPGDQHSPSLYIYNNNYYVVYIDNGNVKVRKYNSTWSSPQDIVFINGVSVQGSPTLSMLGGNFYVSYISDKTGYRNVYIDVYNSIWNLIETQDITSYGDGTLNHTPQINPSVMYLNDGFYVVYELSNAIIPSGEEEFIIPYNGTDYTYRVEIETIRTQLSVMRLSSSWSKIEQKDITKEIQRYNVKYPGNTALNETELEHLFLKNNVDEIEKLLGTSSFIELEDSVSVKLKHSVVKSEDAYYFAYISDGSIFLKIYAEGKITESISILGARNPALYFGDDYLYIAYMSGGNVKVVRYNATNATNLIKDNTFDITINNAKNASIYSVNDNYYLAYVWNNKVYVNEYDINWTYITTHEMNTSIPAGLTLDAPPAVGYNEQSGNIFVVYQVSNKSSGTLTSSIVDAKNEDNETISFNSIVEISDILVLVSKFNSNWSSIDEYSAVTKIETDRKVYVNYTEIQVTGGLDDYGQAIGIDEKYAQGTASSNLRTNNYSFIYSSQVRNLDVYKILNVLEIQGQTLYSYDLPIAWAIVNVSNSVKIENYAGNETVNETVNETMMLSSYGPNGELFKEIKIYSDNITIIENNTGSGYIVFVAAFAVPENVATGTHRFTLTIENETIKHVFELGDVTIMDKKPPEIGNITMYNYKDKTLTYYAGDMLYVSVPVEDDNLGLVKAFFRTYYHDMNTTNYLFKLDYGFKNELEDNNLSDDLRNAFKNALNNKELSAGAKILNISGKEWFISDGYLIKETNESELKVYDTRVYGASTATTLGDPDMNKTFDNVGKTGEIGTKFGTRFVPYSLPVNISGNKVNYSVDVYIQALDMCCNEKVSKYSFSVRQRPPPPPPEPPRTPTGPHPHDNMYVGAGVAVMAPGTHYINDSEPNGVIIINSSNTVLDCNGSTLIGNGTGYGIYNPGFDNVTIKNCIVMNYKYGIYLNYSSNNTLHGNDISNNNIGIYSQNSSSIINSNFVCNNIESDFNSSDWLTTSGDNNICDNAGGWNDTNKTGCGINCKQYLCDLNYDGIYIKDWNDLMTAYKCFLGINRNCNKINYKEWQGMKKEYECFNAHHTSNSSNTNDVFFTGGIEYTQNEIGAIKAISSKVYNSATFANNVRVKLLINNNEIEEKYFTAAANSESKVTFNKGLGTETYSIKLIADPDNEIPEINENNNEKNDSVSCTASSGSMECICNECRFEFKQSANFTINVLYAYIIITKFSTGFATVGDNVTYTIFLRNIGTASAYDLTINDTLPYGFIFDNESLQTYPENALSGFSWNDTKLFFFIDEIYDYNSTGNNITIIYNTTINSSVTPGGYFNFADVDGYYCDYEICGTNQEPIGSTIGTDVEGDPNDLKSNATVIVS
ncbi:hypothetical protein BEH94_04875 [Candidatus Altiarchaeales archaeon WOR_SM1_SCG]|nr:hypothetical protein BEH94_04875 [Candidatus Altiarchaeales archaeon WOR_SM1_SCG]